MDRLEEIIENRKAKVEKLASLGMDAYPSSTGRTHTNAEALEQFDDFVAADKVVTLVGRIRSLRNMGKLAFVNIEDGTSRIQVLVKEENLAPSSSEERAGERLQNSWPLFTEMIDLGDFLEFTGKLFTTKTGEKTLEAVSYKLLAKSLRPLPSEHFGVEDEETKLRKRYLDILFNPEVNDLFVKKAKFWQAFRDFLLERGFLEMYMPVLEESTGGAEAEPFVTHHNALDQDFYLRISLELPLKKMLVAGYEKVFEIGRIFRNEGISATHLQDYTQVEWYWAYSDFEQMLQFTQDMYQYVIEKTFGTLKIELDGKVCDWGGQWERVDYIKLFKDRTGIDLETAGDEQLRSYCKDSGISVEEFAGRGRVIDSIFKKIRTQLPSERPIFLINQPIELEPLAKRDPKNPKIVQRMQILAYGSEQGKGFGELNDPIDQRARFEEQAKLREAGDMEAQMIDEGYVEAMEYGMPPCSGFGVGERLFAVLCGRPVRECVVFPPMRNQVAEMGKSKDTKLAVAVVNGSAGLEKWQELNTIGHLSAAFGARGGKKLFLQDEIETQDRQKIKLNVQHAILIKQASSNQDLISLLKSAKDKKLEVAEFTREMLETTDDKKVVEWTKEKKLNEVEFLGVLVFGSKKEVESLTKEFELYQ